MLAYFANQFIDLKTKKSPMDSNNNNLEELSASKMKCMERKRKKTMVYDDHQFRKWKAKYSSSDPKTLQKKNLNADNVMDV